MSKEITKNTSEYVNENGRFKEGNKGKPKGATNKTTREIRQFITNFLNDKAYEIPHIWNTLNDKEKANLYLHLCRLVLPKPPEDKPEDNKGINPIRFVFSDETNELTPEQENRFIELLQSNETNKDEFKELLSTVSMEQFREIIKKPTLTDEQIERLIDKL
jgi:hypothetical protein